MKRSSVLLVTLILIILVAGFVSIHFYIITQIERLSNITVEFENGIDKPKISENVFQQISSNSTNSSNTVLDQIPESIPFSEVDIFDEDAKDWSSFFDNYSTTGALVFDANNDGYLDVYLTHHNDTWVRPTNEEAIIQSTPHITGNGLYIHQGNDEKGTPIFKQVEELTQNNQTFVREELLIEDYLFPRNSLEESENRSGRASSTAIAVDLNSDGLQDLIVGNTLPGMLWSHPKTQRVLGQFVRPVGRQAVKAKTPLSAQGLYFVEDYQPGDEIDDLRPSEKGMEPYGANSVFLNLGDKDNDGAPEWKEVSRTFGLEGKRNTMALLAEDFDLDGDIDIFEANIMDMDYWPGGAKALAGAANQLYINQYAESGKLTFIEKAEEMGVSGVYNEKYPVPDYYRLQKLDLLPEEYSIALLNFEAYQPDFLEINGEQSEKGQISWAAVAQDVNQDGYPDIWVANDLGFLRLYINKEGKKFELSKDHPRASKSGYWMSLSPADFNGDMHEDLFAGNIGGASMNLAMPIPDVYTLFEPVMSSSTLAQQFFSSSHNSMHAILDGYSGFKLEMPNKVQHSRIMPPDASLTNNIRDFVLANSDNVKFNPNSLDPYEFTWGSTTIDIQNDGKQDLYWVGCLQGRGGGIFPIMGTGPGRLLVNTTTSSENLSFADLTAEHHVFNIQKLKYDKLVDEGYIYRKSPLQNWGKRNMVYSYDVSVWGFQGPGIVEKITNRDLIQTAENGRAAVAADLNNDGFSDLLVRNIGGYDSRSSNSKNLRAMVNGKPQVIPAHDANFPTPTNYEPGSTRVFLNNYKENNWIKVKLIDDSKGSYNRDAIGARVIINDRLLKVNRSGSGGFVSNYNGPLLFGLAKDMANTVRIQWPDKKQTQSVNSLNAFHNGVLTISKSKGIISWEEK